MSFLNVELMRTIILVKGSLKDMETYIGRATKIKAW